MLIACSVNCTTFVRIVQMLGMIGHAGKKLEHRLYFLSAVPLIQVISLMWSLHVIYALLLIVVVSASVTHGAVVDAQHQ